MAKQNKAKELSNFLESKSIEVRKVLPGHLSVEEAVKMAVISVTNNKRIMECSTVSIYRSLMQIWNMGLSLNPNYGEAYLIPYGKECTLQTGYRGSIKLARRSGEIEDLWAVVVKENDDFQVTHAPTPEIRHVEAPSERGIPTHVYAMALYKTGRIRFEVVEWRDVEKAKNLSKKGGKVNPAWGMWENEMAKKVAIKRLSKTLPGEELQRANAIEHNALDGVFLDPEVDELEDFIEIHDVVDADIEEVPDLPNRSLRERLTSDEDV